MDPAIPTVAIHGVGRHERGRIEAGVTATVGRGQRHRLAVSEFNWDQRVDHRSITSTEDALDNMARVSASFHGTASAALRAGRDGLDQRLSQVQLVCCNLLRRVLAAVIAAVFGLPALIFVVLCPAWAVESGPFWPSREAHWVAFVAAPAVFSAAAAVALAVVGLGFLRALVVRSPAPIRSAITASALTCLSPVMMVLTAPLSVSWLFIGALVCFFGLFGLLAFGLYWLLPNGPVFTIFDDFTIAPYVLGTIAVLAILQGIRLLLARAWHEGPVKILLDITRYVGEPEYRHGMLRDLAGFVHDRQGDSPQLVIVAHSLGSVIALDYLCNWRTGDSDRDVTLITLGSPYRRFFLRWLPGVLFDRWPVNTVRRIRARHRSFRWVNVYRPWDYVGTSLPVPDAAFANRSTRQFLRLNGHGNYWGDDVVLSTIETALATLPSSAVPPTDVPERAHLPEPFSGLGSRGRFAAIPDGVRIGAVACFSVCWMVYGFAVQQAELATTRAAIDRNGVPAKVFVAERVIADSAGDDLTAEEFHFIGLDMPPYQLSPLLPASVEAQRIDFRRLKEFVRSDCTLDHKTAWYEDDDMVLCTSRRPVDIAYLAPAASSTFYLPDYPPKFYFRDILLWTLYPAMVIGISFIFGGMFVLLAWNLYDAAIGEEPHSGRV